MITTPATFTKPIQNRATPLNFPTSMRRAFNPCELSREALRYALRMRMRLKIDSHAPLCPFDAAQKLEIEVRLQNIPSMEGMFCRLQGRPFIVLASERPAGRQNFNCAHEIGHYAFGHGESLDEMMDSETLQSLGAGNRRRHTDPKEFLADSFAGFFLMPKSAVDRAFALRNLRPATATPEEIFIIAGYLGVGYRTLITHLQSSLRLLNPARGEELRRWANKLATIRHGLTGLNIKHVTVVDSAWEKRPIDLHVGDHLLVTPPSEANSETKSNSLLESLGDTPPDASRRGHLYRILRQGQSIITCGESTLELRVSRQGYAGRSRYRHLDDPEDDDMQEAEE